MIYSRAHSTRQPLLLHAEGSRASLATGWRPKASKTLKTSVLVIKAEAPRWAPLSGSSGPAGAGEELERKGVARQTGTRHSHEEGGTCFRTRRTVTPLQEKAGRLTPFGAVLSPGLFPPGACWHGTAARPEDTALQWSRSPTWGIADSFPWKHKVFLMRRLRCKTHTMAGSWWRVSCWGADTSVADPASLSTWAAKELGGKHARSR